MAVSLYAVAGQSGMRVAPTTDDGRGKMRLGGVLIILLSCSACASRHPADVSNVPPSPGNDVAVVRRLLRHADAAVRILELCGSKAGRAELKQGCSTGLDAVQKQNAQLQAWERSWSGQQRDSSVAHDDQY